jgi:hypothetical protein
MGGLSAALHWEFPFSSTIKYSFYETTKYQQKNQMPCLRRNPSEALFALAIDALHG